MTRKQYFCGNKKDRQNNLRTYEKYLAIWILSKVVFIHQIQLDPNQTSILLDFLFQNQGELSELAEVDEKRRPEALSRVYLFLLGLGKNEWVSRSDIENED